MACVVGGTFYRGHDEAHVCPQPENQGLPDHHSPQQQITLQTFYIDLTEVTHRAYKRCEQSGACSRADPRYPDFDRPDQPIMNVTWYQADAYCRAMGKRLPTEAQWEAAARGPEGDATPWGNDPVTCDQAVIQDARGRSCGVRMRGGHPENGRPLSVGQRPAGRYGLLDMVGNAEEWVADWYAPLSSCGAACGGSDPAGPCAGEDSCASGRKVVKGGSWYWPSSCATGWHRRAHFPANQNAHHFGFRCAATVEDAAGLL